MRKEKRENAEMENIMKKKIISMIMMTVMATSLMACGGTASDTAKSETVTEAATGGSEQATATTEQAADTAASAAVSGSINGDGVGTAGTLIMATNAEFPPYEYHDGDNIVGIDAEIAAAISEKMGCKLQIEDIAFDSVIPEVTSGKADIGMAGMTVTEERKQSVDFSDTYAEASQVIIVKDDSAIASPDDLKDKIIGVQTGTTGDIYATDDFGDKNVERYNKGMEAVQALSQGKIDAVIIDREPAKVFVKENTGLKILDEAYTTEEYAIAVAKGNTKLLSNINAALAELKADGTLDKIVSKYITAE